MVLVHCMTRSAFLSPFVQRIPRNEIIPHRSVERLRRIFVGGGVVLVVGEMLVRVVRVGGPLPTQQWPRRLGVVYMFPGVLLRLPTWGPGCCCKNQGAQRPTSQAPPKQMRKVHRWHSFPKDASPEKKRLSSHFSFSQQLIISLVACQSYDAMQWHSRAVNQSEHERTAVVCRYAPWWLSGNEFGDLHSGRPHAQEYVPREVYSRFSPELKLLYRHIAEGEGGRPAAREPAQGGPLPVRRPAGAARAGSHRRQQPRGRRRDERGGMGEQPRQEQALIERLAALIPL